MAKQETAVAPAQKTEIVQQKLTDAERFTNKVLQEFTGQAGGEIALTKHQKRLVQNYFISVDLSLAKAETNRLKKEDKYRDSVPVKWENVNMPQLAVNVVSCARIGYDPALPNHINMVPYKNNSTGKYDIGFLPGYRGKELMAMKYGLDIPKDVVVELVYSTDKFRVIKKDLTNSVEGYEFEVVKPFERGDIIGGFYYHVFDDKTKNRLVFYSKAEIDKRKPEYASSEFWGGEKPVWKWNDKTKKNEKVGVEQVEGFYAEMAFKTLYRAAYGAITIDSQKIDDDFIRLSENEEKAKEIKPDEVAEHANRTTVNFEEAEVVQEKLPEKTEPEPPAKVETKTETKPEPPKAEQVDSDNPVLF